ncbi:MAG TPA: MGMT family protein, partial [Anaerolineales bacterium]|nr:MGMT family protein [Anaerolineales bacterium]
KKDILMPELPTLPDPQAFYAQVWNIVVRIPRGKVASYGQIAKMIRPPAGVDAETYAEFGALWVSNAVAASPNEVPWQRVVNSKGQITERDGLEAKRHKLMLEDEGVIFHDRGRIDMRKYGWNGK